VYYSGVSATVERCAGENSAEALNMNLMRGVCIAAKKRSKSDPSLEEYSGQQEDKVISVRDSYLFPAQ
jgi:hypothetical protein